MLIKLRKNIISFNGYGLLFKKLTKLCFAGSAMLFFSYIYFVGAITFSVVERKGLEESTKLLASEISMQELTYLSYEKELTKSVGYSQGFVDAPSIVFTTQKRAVAWNAGR